MTVGAAGNLSVVNLPHLDTCLEIAHVVPASHVVQPPVSRPSARCPTRGKQWLYVDGVRQPKLCMSESCWVCLPFVALDHAAAIAHARPNRFIRLSLAGDDVPTRRLNMTRFRRLVRKLHPGWRDAYHVHRNPRGTGYHLHVWSYGSTVDEAEVSNIAVASGMGREVHVQDAYLPMGGRVPRLPYGMGAVIDRPPDAKSLWPAAEEYLEINNGRLLQPTNFFWRSPQGQSLPDVRTAAADAKRLARHRRR